MVRTLRRMALLLAGGLAAAPAAAQEYTWTPERPDGRGPLGVLGDRVQQQAELTFAYRFEYTNFEGTKDGKDLIFFDEILAFFPAAPLAQNVQTHRFEAAMGLSDDLSFLATLRVQEQEMETLTSDDVFFTTSSSGLGDAEIHALFNAFERGGYRAHLSFGVSIPLGATDETGVLPGTFPGQGRLPYSMQLGTGTFDLMPGLTVLGQNEHGSVGVQGRGRFHLGENDRGYTFGNRVMVTGWMAPRLNDHFSASMRVLVESWEDVQGFDSGLDPDSDPTANAFATGGTRVEIPLGLNLLIPEGRFRGHRLALEWFWPAHQDLHGPQLRKDWSLMLGWQASF